MGENMAKRGLEGPVDDNFANVWIHNGLDPIVK
jgi:hypothetical protein